MSLRNAMRKAAGLLVELPPEEPEVKPVSPADEFAERPAPDIDKLLADAGIKRTVPGASSSSASTPVAPTAKPGGASTPTASNPNRAKTVEQIVRDAPGPNLDEIKAAPEGAPLLADGKVNFAAIYRAAKLPDAPFSAEKMLEMLADLPPDVALETKRQMVKVTLGALGQSTGATPENIVADASRKLAALAAFVEHFDKQSTQSAQKLEKEISELQAQIEAKRKAIEAARSKSTQVTQACEKESDRLDDVLEFFSLDVPPSKYASGSGSTPATSAPAAAQQKQK